MDEDTPKPLSEEEIKQVYECSVSEACAVFGWDRILATLVLCNVLRKRAIEEAQKAKAEMAPQKSKNEGDYSSQININSMYEGKGLLNE